MEYFSDNVSFLHNSSFRDNGNSLLDMIALYCFVNHSDCIIGIADYALTFGVQRQFLTAQDVVSSSSSFCLKISRRAHICPLYIVSGAKFLQCLTHVRGQWFENVRKIWTVHDLGGMLCIYIQTASAADNEKPGIFAARKVAKVF